MAISNNQAARRPALRWSSGAGRLAWIVVGVIAVFALSRTPSSADNTAGASYVGAEKCKMCHVKEYKTWSETKMAKAWELVKNESDVEKCVPCHTTGYGKPGGFKSFRETPKMAGVQCEACHGPASNHLAVPFTDKEGRRAAINREPSNASCTGCHNPHVPNKADAARGISSDASSDTTGNK